MKNGIVTAMELPPFEQFEYSEEAREFKERYLEVLEKDYAGVSEKIAHFARNTLWKKHTPEELHNYEAYCILVGSTPLKQPEYFDLEGKESIARFMESLE